MLLRRMSRSCSNCRWSTLSRNAFLSKYLQRRRQRVSSRDTKTQASRASSLTPGNKLRKDPVAAALAGASLPQVPPRFSAPGSHCCTRLPWQMVGTGAPMSPVSSCSPFHVQHVLGNNFAHGFKRVGKIKNQAELKSFT